MSRQSHIDTPGELHHVICRGIERGEIFASRLGGILVEPSTRGFAWALIPNHFPLLLPTGPTPIGTVMRRWLTG